MAKIFVFVLVMVIIAVIPLTTSAQADKFLQKLDTLDLSKLQDIDSSTEQKVLVIALDGATFDIILPLVRQGKLPNFKKMMNEGTSAELMTVFPAISPAAWPSFLTGKNPGAHGAFYWHQLKPNSYQSYKLSSEDIHARTLYKILSEKDLTVLSLGMPVTHPPQKIKGLLITGWLAPHNSQFTRPAYLAEQLRKIGYTPGRSYKLMDADRITKRVGNIQKYLNSEEAEARFFLFLMKKLKYNFSLVYLSLTDKLMHMFTNRGDSQGDKSFLGYPITDFQSILNIYQKADSIIGQMLRETDEDTTIIIVSDHGMGSYSKTFYISKWLMGEGFLAIEKERLSTDIKLDCPEGFVENVDFGKTKVFPVVGHINQGCLYINLKEKFPEGIVLPGKQYEDLRAEIIRRLKAFRDPQTHQRVVARVYKREDIWKGPSFGQMPDLLFELNDKYVVSLDIPEGGVVKSETSTTHRRNGILLMKGRNIRKGVKMEANIIDVCPTVLYLMELPVPSDIEGKVLTKAISRPYLRRNPIKVEKFKESKPIEKKREYPEVDEELKEKLKSLGYMQ